MRVLLITNDFPPKMGGIARWYERICVTVPPECLFVLAPHMPEDAGFDAKQRYRIVRRRVPIGRHPVARLIQIALLCVHAVVMVRRERIDAIHIGQLHLGPIALVFKLLFKMPFVVYLHGGEMAPYMRLRVVRTVARAIVGHAQTVVVNSKYTLRHFEALEMRNPYIEILTMSVDTDHFHPGHDIEHIRARYSLDGQKVILTVARLDDYKGHDMVIRALNDVRRVVGPVRYLIVGCGREERSLRELGRHLGCSKDVTFVGYVPDSELPSFYAVCDVFIMPSRPLPHGDFEGFGIAFLEAGACGKPAIGGRSGGIPEAVIDGVTGILVDPTDVGAISDALTRLLLNCGEAAQLGERGRLRTKQLHAAWKATLTRIWQTAGTPRAVPTARQKHSPHPLSHKMTAKDMRRPTGAGENNGRF